VRTLASPKLTRYGGALLAIACATGLFVPFRAHVNVTTVAVALLLAILFVAIAFGSKPALVASVCAMLCFNFFFLPPYHTFTIADPQNWVALSAFFITAVVVGQLSARAKHRADEAEAGRKEIRRLYDELQEAFERASEAEATKRSERLKSALLDAVTHDIRTPLTSIKASATLLLEDRDETESTAKLSDEDQYAMLEVIEHSANRLDRFVEGIVDLARIDAGDISLHRNWGAVEDIIDAALAQAVPLTRKHHINVSVAEELPVIRVDARTVAEVIYTLLDNASKYSPSGTTITINARREADDVIAISVEDEGGGIPPHARELVFAKFYRGGGETVSSTRTGIGMGLAIAKGIVEAHGGRIWIEDPASGRGARIVFTVPVGDEEEQIPSRSDTEPRAVASGSPRN
jgi:two-component system sensor histidine kinase KdpD